MLLVTGLSVLDAAGTEVDELETKRLLNKNALEGENNQPFWYKAGCRCRAHNRR